VLELEAASFVLHHAFGDEDDEDPPDRPQRPGGGVGVFRKSTRPGIGETLDEVPRPGWWRKAKTVVIVCAFSARSVYKAGRFTWRHPVLAVESAAGVGLLVAVAVWGVWAVAVPAGMAAQLAWLLACAWAERSPTTFARYIQRPLRCFRRRTCVYRRRWQPATRRAGLTYREKSYEAKPVLGRVRAGTHFDIVRVTMLDGHTVAHWAKAAEQLASSFRVEAVRAYPVRGKSHQVELKCRVVDPLRAVVSFDRLWGNRPAVTPLKVASNVDLARVPVGMREDGKPLLLPANRHLLIAGESRAGKSSLIWALVAGVAPLIAAGSLKVVAIDPKGIELSAGAPLWEGHCETGRAADAARFLEHVVKLMEQRKAELQGKARKIEEFTPKTPARIVIVDEIAALTAWVKDPKIARRLDESLGLIQSQGAALGFWLWAATQLPHKEVLGTVRDLSQARVAFRTSDHLHADMILGQGARNRGALTDQISTDTKGVCYVVEDGEPDPVRARIAYLSDAEIARVASRYGRKLHAVPAAAAS